MAISKLIFNGVVQMDVTQDTVASGNLLSGYTATGADGESVSGGITSQGATTYNVSSSDQTISAGKYLTGAQTIRGVTVSDTLVAANIKDGVTVKIGDAADDDRILSVTGTLSGGGGSYTRTEVCPSQSFTPGSNRRATLSNMTTGLVDNAYYIVTFDNVEWLTTCDVIWTDNYCIGEANFFISTTDSACPFGVIWTSGTTSTVAVNDTSQHTIKIERLVFTQAGTTLTTKSITANGTYNASSDSADGYSSVTVNVSGGGGGGLVYEAGTWTPSEDTATPSIAFTNTHTEAPIYVLITDATGTYYDTSSSSFTWEYADYWKAFGAVINPSSSGVLYGNVFQRMRTNNTSSLTTTNTTLTHNSDDPDSSSSSYPRYWVTETGFNPIISSRYWRTGRTYKWIAIWKPTT